ncbi:MAG: glycosyltransferase [Candidatus Acidiferrum sp.]
MLQIVTYALLLLAILPFIYYLLSLYCIVDYFRTARKAPQEKTAFMPPASIVKPGRGLDYEAYENFASFCRLDYPEYELLFAVSDINDPVITVIEKLRADFPATSIRLITNVPHVGATDKVNNLCQLAQNAKYDLLVMSDVRMEPDYLKQVTAPFADQYVGAVTAFYRSRALGLWHRILSPWACTWTPLRRPLWQRKSRAGWGSLLAGPWPRPKNTSQKLAVGKRWSIITPKTLSLANVSLFAAIAWS